MAAYGTSLLLLSIGKESNFLVPKSIALEDITKTQSHDHDGVFIGTTFDGLENN